MSYTIGALYDLKTSKIKPMRRTCPYFYQSVNLRAIFCKSQPTCDSRVFRISSYFNQLKIKAILEYGQNFSFIRHFVEFLLSRDNSSFSRNTINVHKLYFESPLSLLELLFRVQVTSTSTLLGTEHSLKKSTLSPLEIILFYWPKYLTS